MSDKEKKLRIEDINFLAGGKLELVSKEGRETVYRVSTPLEQLSKDDLKKIEWSMYVDYLEPKQTKSTPTSEVETRAKDPDMEEVSEDEETSGNGLVYVEGVASSTGKDSHGTEMSLDCLKGMGEQIKQGVHIVPLHWSKTSDWYMPEWNETLGKSESFELKEDKVVDGAKGEKHYTLKVRSYLYEDEEDTKQLVKRLKRGELIGQSIGGWFKQWRFIEDEEGYIERIIIEEVVLDHIAITRMPSNPDSIGLVLLNRSGLTDFFNRTKVSNKIEDDHPSDDHQTQTRSEGEGNMLENEETTEETVTEDETVATTDETQTRSAETTDEVPNEETTDDANTAETRASAEMEEVEGELDECNERVEELEDENEQLKSEVEELQAKVDALEAERSSAKSTTDVETTTDNPTVENEEKSKKDEVSIDKETRSNHDHNNNDENSESGDFNMTEQEKKEFAQMIAMGVVEGIRSSATVEALPTKEEPETTPEKPSMTENEELALLRSQVKEQGEIITSIMKSPVRRARHQTTSIAGVGAKTAFGELIKRSRQEGFNTLSAVVESQVDVLSTNEVAKLSAGDLRSMLSAGLNAAEQDGLIGQSTTGWSN